MYFLRFQTSSAKHVQEDKNTVPVSYPSSGTSFMPSESNARSITPVCSPERSSGRYVEILDQKCSVCLTSDASLSHLKMAKEQKSLPACTNEVLESTKHTRSITLDDLPLLGGGPVR